MIRSLRIFCDLAQTHSFTETGQRTYLTQPAVSRHIKALETKFGHRLLERGPRRVRLTPAGQRVYAVGRKILEQFHGLEAELRDPSKDVAGVLRVASIYSIGLYDLPSYTTAFLKRHPKVDLELNYLLAPQIYEAVVGGAFDLGVVDYPKAHPRLTTTVFKTDRLVLVVPPQHRWSARRRVRLSQLHGQPFVMFDPRIPTGKGLQALLKQAGVRVRVVHTFDNVEMIKRAVELGHGVALIPSETVVSHALAGTLKQLELAEGPFERPIAIISRRGDDLSLQARKFVELLVPVPRSPSR